MNIDSIIESPETGHSRYIAERPGFHLLHSAKARFELVRNDQSRQTPQGIGIRS